MSKREIARKVCYGYCRGEEPVKYVSQIQSRYETYVKLVPLQEPREISTSLSE